MRVTGVVLRGSVAATLALSSISAAIPAHALPPPVSDRTGDNVRIVEWDPPVPIPLSRFARGWIARSAGRPVPASVSRRAYAERERLIREWIGGDDVSELLGVDRARDRLDAMDNEHARKMALAFEQKYTGTGAAASVRGARVSVFFDALGTGISRLVSTFQPDVDPPDVEVPPGEAVETALGFLAESVGVPLLAPDDPIPLIVLRAPTVLGGARRATQVRRANDRMAYVVRVVTDDAIQREVAEVLVDAATGERVRVVTLGADVPSLSVKLVPQPLVVPDALAVNAIIQAIICGGFEGQGVDSDLVLRHFSTSVTSQIPPYALVSCQEPAAGRLIGAKDIVTFRQNPTGDPQLELGKVFLDEDDVWNGPDPLLRHAVGVQYWAERVLRFFKRNGYTKREGSNEPIRFVAWQKGVSEQAWFTKLNTPLGTENGITEVGVGGPHFKTAADPMVLAHEFAHSVWRDVNPAPADIQSEEMAISEGISDCFAMSALNDMQNEWDDDPIENPPHLGYSDPALQNIAPFSFWAGSYVDDLHLATPGYPNLFNPKDSWPDDWPNTGFRFTHWSGRRPIDSNYERNSTLLGAVCRLLITGGATVAVDKNRAVTAGGYSSDALAFSSQGINRNEGFRRLTRLLLLTLIDAKNYPLSFHDFIETLAGNAEALGLNEWGEGNISHEQRVKRAFGEYGFGRGYEDEGLGNSAANVNTLNAAAAANLIASGANFFRPIEGTLCTNDEDFFVVNEKAGVGDTIAFTAARTSGTGEFDVRFFRHKACDFSDKSCAANYQVYPPVDAAGNTPESPPLPPFTFTGLSGGGCPPGAPCGGTYWNLFVGIKMKPGGSCKSGYKLQVEFKPRAPGNKGVE